MRFICLNSGEHAERDAVSVARVKQVADSHFLLLLSRAVIVIHFELHDFIEPCWHQLIVVARPVHR